MKSYKLKIQRKYNYLQGGINPPATISIEGNDYVIENGKSIEINLPEGKKTIIFSCTFTIGGKETAKESSIDIDLCQNSEINLTCSNGLISAEYIIPKNTHTAKSQKQFPQKPKFKLSIIGLIIMLCGAPAAAIKPPIGVIFISLPCLLVGAFLMISKVIKNSQKHAYDAATKDVPDLVQKMNYLGAHIPTSCKTLEECTKAFNSHTASLVSKKTNDFKEQHQINKIYPSNVAFTDQQIIYNIRFPQKKSITFISDTNTNFKLIDDVKNSCWNQSATANFILYENIEYFTTTGDVHYETKVSGGGVNLTGAVVGGALFGNAGAIVGSKVGTDISSETKRMDGRKLIIHILNGSDITLAHGNKIEDLLIELRKRIPEKEYFADRGFANFINNKNN